MSHLHLHSCLHCFFWFLFSKRFKPPVAATHTPGHVCHIIFVVLMCSTKYCCWTHFFFLMMILVLISMWAFHCPTTSAKHSHHHLHVFDYMNWVHRSSWCPKAWPGREFGTRSTPFASSWPSRRTSCPRPGERSPKLRRTN